MLSSESITKRIKHVLEVFVPNRRSINHKRLINQRFNQLFNIIINSLLKDSLSIKGKHINKKNKVDILVIIQGSKIKGLSKCPTTQRLLNLSKHKLNIIYINDPLSSYCEDYSSIIISRSKDLIKEFFKCISMIKALNNYWKKIFEYYQPSLIISIMPNISIITAAREKDINVADIQHGVISSIHDWYLDRLNYTDSVFKGYEPNYIFVWSKKEIRILNKMYKRENKQCQFKIIGPNMINSHKKILSVKNILITCSWGFQGFYTKEEIQKLDKYFLTTQELYNWLNHSSGYSFRFRLHPSVSESKTAKKQIQGINKLMISNKLSSFEVSKGNSLEDDLLWSEMHFTLNSSCVIEAYYLSIASCMFCPSLDRHRHNIFEDLDGFVFKRNEYDSIDDLINASLKFQISDKHANAYNKDDHQASLIKIIKQLIS